MSRNSDNPLYGSSAGTEYDPVVFFAIPECNGPMYDSIK